MRLCRAGTMLVLIDNYDSFTYNLLHYLGELGAVSEIYRNDAISVDEVIARQPGGVVLSPGPCDPMKAGICLELVQRSARERLPLLGVCLGHQSIGQAFGGTIGRAPLPMHGKLSGIDHDGTGVFRGIRSPLRATRYHSLAIMPDSVPECLDINARTGDGVIMGVRHRELPIHGVQFHPESIESEHGHAILQNFLDLLPKGGVH